MAMDQSHHHAETNKSVLNKYLALDQGNRYVSLRLSDYQIIWTELSDSENISFQIVLIPLNFGWLDLFCIFSIFFPLIFNVQGASSLHLD